MDLPWLIIIGTTFSVYLVIGTGAAVRQIGWLTEEADQSLLRLMLRVLYPCLIFSVVADNPALKQGENLYYPPVVAFGSIMLGFAVAGVVARLGRSATGLTTAASRRQFTFSVGIYNYGFVPIPLIRMLFDDPTLGVLFVHNVAVDLTIWTIGIMLLRGSFGRDWWRHLLNPPAIALAVSLAVNFLGAKAYLPTFLYQAVGLLGQAAIPMSLVLVGATMADEVAHARRKGGRIGDGAKTIGWACLVRLLVLPMLFLTAAVLLPCSIELKRVMVVQAAMPSAVLPVVLARIYAGDAGVGLQVALTTSLMSIATIPLWIVLGMTLIG